MFKKIKSFIKNLFGQSECINENFIQMNPEEIDDFISGNNNFIEFINLSFIYIKKYFPNSNIYLEFVEDPEYEGLDSIFATIYDATDTFENNFIFFDDLLSDFIKLEKQFGLMNYCLDLTSGEDYFINRLKN